MKRCDEITLDFSQAPKTAAPVYLHETATALPVEPLGPFVRNQAGEVVGVDKGFAYLSSDDGQSWRRYPIFDRPGFSFDNSRSLVCLQSGVVLLSFANMGQFHFNWHGKTNRPTKNSQLHHWVVRSLDGGRTWESPQCVQKGYAAAMTTAIQLQSGEVVLSAQNLDYENGRHYALSLVSKDDGVTWQASNRLDIGGEGHHGGCYEGTLTELENGRVWYCIRTNLGWFWHAYSENGGVTWSEIKPGLKASSSPGMLTRLRSGRLMLTYNPYQSLLEDNPLQPGHLRAGQFSEVEASWFREELAVRFSEDEGQSWSEPLVVAQCDNAWLSYPYVFEANPGEIWITTMQSELKVLVKENELF